MKGKVSTLVEQCGAMKLKKILRFTTSAKFMFTTAPGMLVMVKVMIMMMLIKTTMMIMML